MLIYLKHGKLCNLAFFIKCWHVFVFLLPCFHRLWVKSRNSFLFLSIWPQLRFPSLAWKKSKDISCSHITRYLGASNTPAPMWKYNTSKVDIQDNRKLTSNCYKNKFHIWHAYTKSVLKFQAAAMNTLTEICLKI